MGNYRLFDGFVGDGLGQGDRYGSRFVISNSESDLREALDALFYASLAMRTHHAFYVKYFFHIYRLLFRGFWGFFRVSRRTEFYQIESECVHNDAET